VFVVVRLYFIIESVQKLLDIPSYMNTTENQNQQQGNHITTN